MYAISVSTVILTDSWIIQHGSTEWDDFYVALIKLIESKNNKDCGKSRVKFH